MRLITRTARRLVVYSPSWNEASHVTRQRPVSQSVVDHVGAAASRRSTRSRSSTSNGRRVNFNAVVVSCIESGTARPRRHRPPTSYQSTPRRRRRVRHSSFNTSTDRLPLTLSCLTMRPLTTIHSPATHNWAEHFAWVVDDAKCIVVTRVCVCVCLSLAAFPHYCTDLDVTLEW